MSIDINEFWSVPDLINEDGAVSKFSNYLVHKKTGDIWSLTSNRYLKPCPTTGGYLNVVIIDDSKKSLSQGQHRVVLAAKLGHWNWEEAEHKNKIRWDNKPENLEPTDRLRQFDEACRLAMSEAKKGKRANSAVFKDDEVRSIRNNWGKWDGNTASFTSKEAERLGVTPVTIYNLITGRTYSDLLEQEEVKIG